MDQRTKVTRTAGAIALATSLFLASNSVWADEPGDAIKISILTFGPGDHPFFKFGHNAILVHDPTLRGRDPNAVYNFGTFSFTPDLIPTFLRGKMNYWLSVQSLPSTIAGYRAENRTIEAQELNLTAAQKVELVRKLRHNALPQNKEYKYDYYRDNCSTRVRDYVDNITEGRLKAASGDPASMSWRQHTLRLTADDFPIYLGLNVAMGHLIDSKVTVWEEMFLPAKLQETLRKVTVPGPDGQDVPLVKSETVMLDAEGRSPMRKEAPSWTLPLTGLGVLLGGSLGGLGHLGATKRGARIGFGLLLSLYALFFGIVGMLFGSFWAFTDHEVTYKNENVLQCGVWLLPLIGFGIGVARDSARSKRWAWYLASAAAGLCALGLVLKILPWFDQNNGQIIAICLPLWLGAAFGTWQMNKATAQLVGGPID